MGDIPGSSGCGGRLYAFVTAVAALWRHLGGLRGTRWFLAGLCGLRLLSGPLRGLPGRGDVRAGLREIDDLRERVAASLRRCTVVGYFAGSRIRTRHQERVQAGACLGVEVPAHVPPAGPFLAQPEFASLTFRLGIVFGLPIRIVPCEQVGTRHGDVARSCDSREFDQALFGVKPLVRL
ncbi:hypothetical protein ED92_19630 [Amycolatopsis sp. MJM2582]|nr:hypothetical protein ED92_19630 [Amycolatopsis sp. MJM2582]